MMHTRKNVCNYSYGDEYVIVMSYMNLTVNCFMPLNQFQINSIIQVCSYNYITSFMHFYGKGILQFYHNFLLHNFNTGGVLFML